MQKSANRTRLKQRIKLIPDKYIASLLLRAMNSDINNIVKTVTNCKKRNRSNSERFSSIVEGLKGREGSSDHLAGSPLR
jgi:fructose-1,6-bisphosphatase